MPRTPKILIISPDDRLRDEVAAALKGIADTAAVLHYVPDYRQGCEAARNRRPDLALVEMSQDFRALRVLAEEVSAGSPETTLAAVFSPDVFGPDVSESAVLIEGIRTGLQDFLRRPLSRADLEQLLERYYRKLAGPRQTRFGKIISFISNKGGVGKSTLAVNTACALAQRFPGRVLLVDASVQHGVCAIMLDLKPATGLIDAVREQQRLDETLVEQLATPHACGLQLLAAPANALEGAEVDEENLSRVLTLARRAYDYVIVDTFPMLDRVIMAVLDLSDLAYIVLKGTVPTVLGIVRLLEVLDGLGIPQENQRIIVNRYTAAEAHLHPKDIAMRLKRDVNHVIPYQRKVVIASNIGKPFILQANRFFGFAPAIRRIAEEIIQTPTVSADAPAAPTTNGKPPVHEVPS
ncbi:MAG: CpaE family protein [Gemmataceae bacterium]